VQAGQPWALSLPDVDHGFAHLLVEPTLGL